MSWVIGSDECGYGAYAGPLVVCAVAVQKDWKGPAGLNDSKALSERKRLAIYPHLYRLPSSVIVVPNGYIDDVGVLKALVQAHASALLSLLRSYPDADVIVDGTVRIPEVPQARIVPKADSLFPAVMAASIVGKVNRDFLMREHHKSYPHYGWERNKGYGGNVEHENGLRTHGVSPLHRRSYAPIKRLLENA